MQWSALAVLASAFLCIDPEQSRTYEILKSLKYSWFGKICILRSNTKPG